MEVLGKLELEVEVEMGGFSRVIVDLEGDKGNVIHKSHS